MPSAAEDEPGSSTCAVESLTDPAIVVFTFDDGPEPGPTESILNVLAQRQATATFFVLMSRVRPYASLFQEVVAAGHEIGLHGLDHRRLTTLPVAEVQRNVVVAKAQLEDTLGEGIRWFRPPYGAQSIPTWHAVRSADLSPVMWGAALQDWLDLPTSKYLQHASELPTPGGILLAHDGYAAAMDGVDDGPPPRLNKAELIGKVLDLYGSSGLRAYSLGRALACGVPSRRIWLDDAAAADSN